MTHDEIREALGAFALDAVGPDERAEIEAHLETCAECRMEYEQLGFANDNLALMVEEMDPPPALRGRLLAIVEQERTEWIQTAGHAPAPAGPPGRAAATATDSPAPIPLRPDVAANVNGRHRDGGEVRASWRGASYRLSSWYYVAGGAVLAAAVLLIAILVYRHNQSQVSVVARAACAIAHPSAHGLDLRGTGCNLQERSDHTTRVAFTGLPALPSGKAYELWLIPSKGAPVRVGGFEASGARFTGTYPVDARRYALAAVTVERAPGNSPVPTSAPIITFTLQA